MVWGELKGLLLRPGMPQTKSISDQAQPGIGRINPGVESCKSIFFGVEWGEGVAGDRVIAVIG